MEEKVTIIRSAKYRARFSIPPCAKYLGVGGDFFKWEVPSSSEEEVPEGWIINLPCGHGVAQTGHHCSFGAPHYNDRVGVYKGCFDCKYRVTDIKRTWWVCPKCGKEYEEDEPVYVRDQQLVCYHCWREE